MFKQWGECLLNFNSKPISRGVQRPLSFLYLLVSSGEVSNAGQSYVNFWYARFLICDGPIRN
jgi:hypothetical protein